MKECKLKSHLLDWQKSKISYLIKMARLRGNEWVPAFTTGRKINQSGQIMLESEFHCICKNLIEFPLLGFWPSVTCTKFFA